MSKSVSGFSKMSKRQKIKWLAEQFFRDPEGVVKEFAGWLHESPAQQEVIDGFTENAVTNFPLPYSIAPNFMINGKVYAVPMVIEESSVVAAASSAAKFWMERGGFHAEVLGTVKVGQVHFKWLGDASALMEVFPAMQARFLADTQSITTNMQKRGGGIVRFELLDMTDKEPNYYQLRLHFETCDSMGANFINSVLEQCAKSLEAFIEQQTKWQKEWQDVEIIMSILSNYTPECIVKAWVECPLSAFDGLITDMDGTYLGNKFATAVRIAQIDPYRATTHNKGIFNGIDAVVLATGNDFRAIEASGHAFAARNGSYASLSSCTVENGIFHFELTVPLALGTVGGLTALHPIAKRSLELLGNPGAEELMKIIAVTGLAQNFAAVRSLVTTGIQKGHMKMHLNNILQTLKATPYQMQMARIHFAERTVTYNDVREFLQSFCCN